VSTAAEQEQEQPDPFGGVPRLPADTRPMVCTNDGELWQQLEASWHAILESLDPEMPAVMLLHDKLVRATAEGALQAYDVVNMQVLLSRVARYRSVSGKGDFVPQTPPRDVALAVVGADTSLYGDVPRVDFVVDVPVVGSDGSLIERPGYHRNARLYYQPTMVVPPIDVSHVDDVEEARDLIMNDLLGDFVFPKDDGGASKANAAGLMLLPFAREFIGDAPTPLHVIKAVDPGTGKSWLARVALAPGLGDPGFTPEISNADELRKNITATLARGGRAITFDNISKKLDSGILSMAITSGVWRDRKLGETTELVLPMRMIWLMTGNAPQFTDELQRRTVTIWLEVQPGDKVPSERKKSSYRHPDLPEWARANRPKLVSACLTLVLHWLEGEARMLPDGTFARDEEYRTPSHTATFGSFERYEAVIGGILAAAGIKGFLGNRETSDEDSNQERDEREGFFAQWYEVHPEPILCSVLAGLCGELGSLRDVLPGELLEVPPAALQGKLIYWLRSNKGRAGNLILKHAPEKKDNSHQWVLEPVRGR
jgi:putative DNA primase/helicase